MLRQAITIGLLVVAGGVSSQASDIVFRKESITAFGGVYTTVNMGESFSPFANHDSTYFVGGAYRREFEGFPWNILIGAEAGAGLRFGTGSFGEFWVAPTARAAVPLGDTATMWLGLAAGFSLITNPTGLEQQREHEHSGNSKLLFYFSPELSFAFKQWPSVEVVFRLQHRSGLYGTLGRMREGSNAHVVGIRWYR
jgi:hypothetical protein